MKQNLPNESNKQTSPGQLARILVIESDRETKTLISQSIGDLGEIRIVDSNSQMYEQARQYQPDIVVLCSDLEDEYSLAMCRRFKSSTGVQRLILLTAESTDLELMRELTSIVDGHVIKPIAVANGGLRSLVQHYLEAGRLKPRLQPPTSHTKLNSKSPSAVYSLSVEEEKLMVSLRQIIQEHDNDKKHLSSVSLYARRIAQQLRTDSKYADQIDDRFQVDLRYASQLHDIGNVGIDQSISLNARRLSKAEFLEVQKHTEIGYHMVDEIIQVVPESTMFQMAREITIAHHEHWNGKGYPHGLHELQIPLSARIVAVADVFDALTSHRAFRDAYEVEWARNLILSQAGQQFDPIVVRAFETVYADLELNCKAMRKRRIDMEQSGTNSESRTNPQSHPGDNSEIPKPNISLLAKAPELELNWFRNELQTALLGGDFAKLKSLANELQFKAEECGQKEYVEMASDLQTVIDRNESINGVAHQLEHLLVSLDN